MELRTELRIFSEYLANRPFARQLARPRLPAARQLARPLVRPPARQLYALVGKLVEPSAGVEG